MSLNVSLGGAIGYSEKRHLSDGKTSNIIVYQFMVIAFLASLTLLMLHSQLQVSAQTTVLDGGVVFDSAYYAAAYPDVYKAFGNNYNALLNHYLTYGVNEGRNPSGRVVTLSDGTVFDADYYSNTYADLKAAFGGDFGQLLNHYLTYGIKENRKPSANYVSSKSGSSSGSSGSGGSIEYSYTEPSMSFDEKVKMYKSEAKNANYSYTSDTLFVTITKKTYGSGVYYLTHVIISDPSQIKGGLSYGTFGGTRQLTTSFASDNNAIVVTNGSYFSYNTGQPTSAGLFINNGTIIKDGVTNGKEVCLKSDGTLFTPASGLTAQQLIDAGVVCNWGTVDTLMISDGVLNTITSDKSYPRTAYGMVEPCEYYIITAGSDSYGNGLSLTSMQSIFNSLGCTYARSLDGGGSASLVFKGTLINSPAAGSQRAVVDFVYFTD